MALPEEIAQEFPDEAEQEVEQEVEQEAPEVEAEAPEPTEEEQEAMEHGWNPEGTDKDGNTLSATEYMARKPLFNKIKNLNGELGNTKAEIRKMKETLDAMKKHTETVSQRAYERAVTELKAKKKEAAEIGDTSTMLAIDEQMETLEKPEPIVEENPIIAEYEATAEKFKSDNEWYVKDEVLAAAADKIGTDFAQSRLNKDGVLPPPQEVFDYVLEKMSPKLKAQTTKVASSPSRAVLSAKKKHSLSELSEEDRSVASKLIRGGVMTEEEYLKDYFGE